MKFTHARKKGFTGFLVGRHLERSIGLGKGAKGVNKLGQVLHALWLNSNRDNRVRVVANRFKGREVLVSRKGYTSSSRTNTGYSCDVSGHHFGHRNSVATDHHGHLLNTLGFGSTNGVHGFTLIDGT